MTDKEFDTLLEEWFDDFEFSEVEEDENKEIIETENGQTIPKELVQQSFNGNQKITTLNYN